MLEPVGALPVIIEDDVLVGESTGIYEGTVIKQRAVVAAGVILTGSTPLTTCRAAVIRAADGQPLVARRSRRGRPRRNDRRRPRVGPVPATPVIVEIS